MRLICPNCDAQYEVPDDVMPEAGRDVQCSNCGQTWFQHHPDHAPEDADEALTPEPEAPHMSDPDEEVVVARPEPQPQVSPEAESPTVRPTRRSLDPQVADILREEAQHEAQVRRQPPPEPMESQPDLGLDDNIPSDDGAVRRAREARDRMARMRGEEPPSTRRVSEEDANAAAIGSRRDLLPDIEEINSTLRSTSDRATDVSADVGIPLAASRSGGFRWGFVLTVLVAVIFGLIYVYAPELAQAVPQTDPWVSSYVGQVDNARMWLDGQVTSLLIWLDAMASESSNG